MSELAPEEAFPGPQRTVERALKRMNAVLRDALAGKAGLLCALAVLFAAGWAYSVDWGLVASSFSYGRPDYHIDAAVLAEAKKLGLDYDVVAAEPSKYAGKPVIWCLVKELPSDRVYVDGNIGWAVNMPGGSFNPVATARMGACKKTLAVIEKSTGPGVHLAFLAHL